MNLATLNTHPTLPFRWRLLAMLALLLFSLPLGTFALTWPGASWETRTPAQLGLDGAKLDTLAANIGGNGIIIREGYVVKTWGNQTAKADWASAAKPVISTMLFFAIKEGIVSNVNAKISNYNWALVAKDQTMEFQHLANMTSGYARSEAPGARWAYSDYAINLYAKTLFDRAYGNANANTVATATNRLGALGFQDGTIFSSRGGYGITTSVRDFARIGWLWCNRGYWNGQQLLPKQFFDDYMKAQVPAGLPRTSSATSDYLSVGTYGGGSDQTADGPGVYGFNWWCNPNKSNWPDAPADTVQANGHWGLEVVTVIPSLSVVVATYGGNMGTHTTGSSASAMNQNLKLLTEACPPLPIGYIIPDPDNPTRMVYSNTYENGRLKPVFFAGPGDPEDLLWVNSQNNVNFLISKGARCTYITAVLQDFGGGNPGTGAALDAKLNEWENYITQMENAGIITVFFFFDDSQPLVSNWQELVDKCVAKFQHHKLLIWSVAEEYAESLTTTQVSQVAARIKQQDPIKRVVGVHLNNGNTFPAAFMSDTNINMYLMQLNGYTPDGLHSAILGCNARGTKILNMAEAEDHAKKDRTTVRQMNWASAMASVSAVQVLWMGRATDDSTWNEQGKYDDCARLMDFMEGATLLNSMTSWNSLANGATKWVLANPGQAYIAYATSSGAMGLKGMAAANYHFRWMDIPSGTMVQQVNVPVSAGDQTWARPPGIGDEAAVYVVNATNFFAADITPPTAQSATSTASNRVVVLFSEMVEASSATNVANYALVRQSTGSPLAISAASLGGDGRTVTLTTAALSEGATYTLTVNGVRDLAVPPNTIAPNTQVQFTYRTLLAWWRFSEGSGSTTADSSGHGHTATIGNPSWGPGYLWLAGGFNYPTTPSNPPALRLTGPMTLSAWTIAAAASVSGLGRIISKGGNSGSRGWELNAESSGAYAFQVASNATTLVSVSGGTVPTGGAVADWRHVAGVYDPAAGRMSLYTNGVLAAQRTTGVPAAQFDSGLNVTIGYRPDGTLPWAYTVDDVRIYNRALSVDEIRALPEVVGGSSQAVGLGFLIQYKTRQAGLWGDSATWHFNTGSGNGFVNAPDGQTPTSGDDTILITNAVTVAANVTADQVTVGAGGELTVNNGQTLTVANGAGTDLVVNGTLAFVGNGKLAGAGQVSLNAGGTVVISDANGITTSGASGNIQSTGTRTYSTGANYTYAGTANQAVGNGLPGTVADLTVNNPGNTVTLASNVLVSGTLTLTAGTLNANGNDMAANQLAGSGTLGNTGAAKTLTVGGGGGSSAFGGAISGALTLTKSGAGVLTLSGVNTYNGTTVFGGGTLALSGSGALVNTPEINLAAGATLSVAGIVPASYSLSGSSPQQTLACGSGSGAASVDATGKTLVLASGALATFKADGTGGTVGRISVTGNLELNANAITVAVENAALGLGTYRLLECSGTLANTGTFGAPSITGLGLAPDTVATLNVVTGAGGYLELQVSSTSMPAPEFLPPMVVGDELILNWTGSGQLQSAPEVTGVYTNILPTPTPPYANQILPGQNQFFRIKK